MDFHLEKLKSLMNIELNEVRVVGIYGIGGIGKTTIAKAIYNDISYQFDGSSFLNNVRERSKDNALQLQQELLHGILKGKSPKVSNMDEGIQMIKRSLSSKRVLVVFDDVDDLMQIENLAEEHSWFGPRSRIIITTRHKHFLTQYGVKESYEVPILHDAEAIELFSWWAFKQNLPNEIYKNLSYQVVDYAKGLPLALEVLGSFLFKKTISEWESALCKLKTIPHMGIQNVLKISYDGLDDVEKGIFLDIACFFKGKDKDFVSRMLDEDFYAESGIGVLHDKCLISISGNKLDMHDLLQQMGWEIVRQECPKEPGRRSRLWEQEDIFDVLKRNMGSEKIEGIFLDLSHLEDILNFTTEAFAGMKKLRLLKVYNSKSILGDFGDTFTFNNKVNCRVRFAHEFKFCSDDLRYLYWHGYSLKSLPKDFSPKHLVDLSMPYSHIKKLWKGIKVLKSLKSMDLSHSKCLIETPDFSGITNLERLVLEGCINLPEVHPSLGDLKKLNFLSLKDCKMLRRLPSRIWNFKSLRTLILSGCSKFEEFPENFGNLEMLKELHEDGTVVRALPPSNFSMRNLKKLSFRGCGPASASWLWSKRSSNSICFTVPSSSNLCYLKKLDLSDCNISDGANLGSLGFLSSLEDLNLSGNNFVTLPNMSGLSHLVFLGLENCKRLQALPQFPSSLEDLILRGNNFVTLPNMSGLSHLKTLVLGNCKRLEALPQLPSSIRSLNATDCTSLGTTESLKLLRPWELESLDSDVAFVIPGSRIPDWIRYQSSENVIEADLPLNWSTNCLGFALALVFSSQPPVSHWLWAEVFLDFGTCCCSIETQCFFHLEGDNCVLAHEVDHVLLNYVPVQPSLSPHQVIHIKATFAITSETGYEIKRCGLGLVYVNEEVNCNNVPPPNESTLVLKEISAGEPIECEDMTIECQDQRKPTLRYGIFL
ncbi:TMV resistance protein N [Vitis vinifera]|uniref:ADP-ribosyl cyclase/cyclic ADP-ribose hydrolase n=1 Tax=Vitis vinifera TaxID=29760 RepID=A0A438C7X5_VITVI|nr:TMV resistance protein N [Vitis vinifera]